MKTLLHEPISILINYFPTNQKIAITTAIYFFLISNFPHKHEIIISTKLSITQAIFPMNFSKNVDDYFCSKTPVDCFIELDYLLCC